jgi:hypothetical protein
MGDDLLLRFDEPATEVLPSEANALLVDLKNTASTTLPEVVTGAVGFAREFVAGDATGLLTTDVDSGSSLFARTLSVQMILRWDIDDQNAYANPGVVIARGIRGSAAERVAYGLELRVVNAAARIGEVRWFWENLAGTRYDAPGGQFKLGRASETMMLTAVRRWIASDEVVVRYFLGDRILNEAVTDEGEIGGGTTGTLTIGGRVTDGADTWVDHLDGSIDELRVVGREIVAEEVAATWARISVIQPLGEQLYQDSLPPGMPVSDDPDSRVQREHRMIGQGLGFAAAQAENLRTNVIPDRAYGTPLDRWQRMTRQPTRPRDEVETRRKRVAGHLARHAGVSPPGVRAALAELLACGGDQIDLVAYDNTVRDSFSELVAARWRLSTAADWAVASGVLTAAVDAAEVASFPATWRTCMTGVDGPERVGGFGAQLFAKVTPSSLPDGAEAGIMLYDWTRQDALMLGLRRDGADYQVVSQRYLGGAPSTVTIHATTALEYHLLHLEAAQAEYDGQAPSDLVDHRVRWSSETMQLSFAGFDSANPGDFSFAVGWAGFYARAWDGSPLSGAVAVDFDDAAFRFPNGLRPFHFYAVRDPDLPGEYDLAGANNTLRKLRQSHTHAAAVTGPMLAGDPESGCGIGPCGGID